MNEIKVRQLLQSPRFLLCCLSAMVVLIRYLTFYEPYERDLMMYAVTAHEMLAGRPLYSDLWDIKPPGIYFAYAVSQLLVGYSRFSIFLLGISCALATLIGIYRVVKTLTGREIIALWSAFFWSLLCSDILLQANQPNVEVFLNAFSVWAFFFFIRAYPDLQTEAVEEVEAANSKPADFSLRSLFIAGFFWGLASLFKQVALTTPLLLGVYVLTSSASGRAWHHRFSPVFALISPIISLWIALAAYFGATGRWDIFRFTMVDYGRYYASASAQFASHLGLWERLFPKYIDLLIPAVILSLLGWFFSWRKASKIWPIWCLYGFSIELAVIAPGNYFAHYYQLWLPLLCIVLGVATSNWRNSRNETWVVRITFTAALVTMACQWLNWNLTPQQTSIKKYASIVFVNLPEEAKRIDALLLPEETFYQYGYDAGLYFETNRRPPIGIINVGTPYVLQPLRLQNQIILDLSAKKPEMVIIDTVFPASDVTRYIYENYVVLPNFRPPNGMIVLARRDGKLLARQRSRR